MVRHELKELRKLYGEPRRTTIGGESAQVELADESTYIIEEDTFVIVTADGWIKGKADSVRSKKCRSVMATASWPLHSHHQANRVVFSTLGGVYVMRIDDIPSTSGYGDPLQILFFCGR